MHSPRVVGRYAMFDEIAAGGMATVHLGRLLGSAGFARTVAIKRLHPALAKDEDFVTMLLDEARLASRIRHPHVVPTLDVIAEADEVLLVMEYVQGESLSRLMRAVRPAPVPLPIAVAVGIQMLHGLHAAHEAKTEQGESLHLVHRDVSPQNVLVGIDGIARVLDFGVAKAAHRAQTTREGQIKGKLSYMAPEQLRRDDVDRRTDVYAASVVIWEALTGTRLFEASSEARAVMKILDERVARPSEVAPGVPSAIDAIVMRGLARDQHERFATAREMAVALERCGLPIAPSSVIGEWVESLASEKLSVRASRIAEIESSTHLLPDAPPSSRSRLQSFGSMPTPAAATRVQAEPEQLPTAGVYTSPTLNSQILAQPKSRRALFVAFIAAGLLGGALIVMSKMKSENPAPTAAVAPAAASAAAVALPSSPEPLPPPTETAAPAASPIHSVASAKPTSTPAAATKAASPAVKAAASPPPAAASKKNECSPPYTVDKDGIRHIKPGCL